MYAVLFFTKFFRKGIIDLNALLENGMFKSQKFPVQHRNKCYCQLKNHCFHKCVSSNRKSKGTNFFIKKNIIAGEPSHVDAIDWVNDAATLPLLNVFKKTFQNTLEHQNANAFLHRSDTPDDQQISFTSIRKNYEAQSNAAARKRSTTRQNESTKYRDASDISFTRISDDGDDIATLYKQQQSKCPAVSSCDTFSRGSFSTTSSLRMVNQPKHVCEIHYNLNELNHLVPVRPNADGLMQCYICDKLFDFTAKMPGIFRESVNTASSANGDADVPSLISELSSCKAVRVLLRNDLNNLVDLRINFPQTPPYSCALKHQLRH